MNLNTILPARFTSNVNDTECALELHLNTEGRLMGHFHADGETLEVYGGVPNAFGEVFGLLNAPDFEQPLAVFRANFVGSALLEFEVDTPEAHDLMAMGNATRLVFKRVEASSTGQTLLAASQGKVLRLQPAPLRKV